MSLRNNSLGWHAGEHKMQVLMDAPTDMSNPTSPFLSPYGGRMLQQAPLLAVGTMDAQERIWTTLWGGEQGFIAPLRSSIMAVKTLVDQRYDPVIQALFHEHEATEEGQALRGQQIAALSIDPAERSRLKLAGKVIAGGVIQQDEQQADESSPMDFGEVQLAIKVESSLGNCPKYINKKDIVPALPEPQLLADSLPLPDEALNLIRAADMFFLTSSIHGKHFSTNHRGGSPGFVRVLSNSSSLLELVYPEYSGNRLYQSLGNLQLDPSVGLVFPDFESGDVLYLSGVAEILLGDAAVDLLPRQRLVMKLAISSIRFVGRGLAFRGSIVDYSPYNPQLRYLASEGAPAEKSITATVQLVSQTKICPKIARFRFRIHSSDPSVSTWKPGQYAALSFASHFDQGYSHMRDNDPKSLNDDYIRTFTVTSLPDTLPAGEFELTIRQVGQATDLLFRKHRASAPLTLGFLGFAGDFRIEQSANDTRSVPFIAGGIGITSLISQLGSVDVSRLRLFWAIQTKDLDLVIDTFAKMPGLSHATSLFLSGTPPTVLKAEMRQELEARCRSVATRRLVAEDLHEENLTDRFYLCVSPVLRRQITSWLDGKECVYEDYGF